MTKDRLEADALHEWLHHGPASLIDDAARIFAVTAADVQTASHGHRHGGGDREKRAVLVMRRNILSRSGTDGLHDSLRWSKSDSNRRSRSPDA